MMVMVDYVLQKQGRGLSGPIRRLKVSVESGTPASAICSPHYFFISIIILSGSILSRSSSTGFQKKKGRGGSAWSMLVVFSYKYDRTSC